MTARQPVMVIIPQSASPYYFDPMMRSGRLPNWSRIVQNGVSGLLEQPMPPGDGVWITLYTGLDPDQTGLISLLRADARKFPPVWTDWIDSREFSGETFLSIASDAGRRVAGVNLPSLAPAWPINGVLIPGVPVNDEAYPPTYPPDLLKSLGPMNEGSVTGIRPNDVDACRRFFDENLARAVDVGMKVFAQESWDLFVVVINTTDYAHHFLHENAALGGTWRSMVEEYFERTDSAIGEFMNRASPDTRVFVLSERGCGESPTMLFHANQWLAENGFLTVKGVGIIGALLARGIHSAHELALHTGIATAMRRYLPKGLVDSGRIVADHWAFVDFGRTRAYAIDFGYPMIGIQVNLHGREPRGTVLESEFEAVRSELIERIGALKMPGTDRPLCRWVSRREDAFSGAERDSISDIVGELDMSVEISTALGYRVFEPNPGHSLIPFRGYHVREGVFAAMGPNIPAGVDLGMMHVRDVVPTILGAMGLDIPSDRRGKDILATLR